MDAVIVSDNVLGKYSFLLISIICHCLFPRDQLEYGCEGLCTISYQYFYFAVKISATS